MAFSRLQWKWSESDDDMQAKTDAGIYQEENWSIASLLGSNSQINTASQYVWGDFLDVYLMETENF